MLYYMQQLKRRQRDFSDISLRQKCGELCGKVGIGLNILLFAAKLIVALASGSAAVLADAVNNLSDAASSVVGLLGFKLSKKRPDPEHPFGHGRVEYIAGFVISIVIILMGFELGSNAFSSLREARSAVFTNPALAVLAASVLVKLYMAAYNHVYAKRFDSLTMKATALDSLCDAIATSVVLCCAVTARFTALRLDAYAGIAVSAFILYTGICSARDTLKPLIGGSPKPEFTTAVRELVERESLVLGVHDLVVHDYGHGRYMLSLHAEVPADTELHIAHEAADRAERMLYERLGCEAVIHLDPVDLQSSEREDTSAAVEGILKQLDPRLTMHDFQMKNKETGVEMSFDVVAPYDCELSDKTLVDSLNERISQQLSGCLCSIKLDRATL